MKFDINKPQIENGMDQNLNKFSQDNQQYNYNNYNNNFQDNEENVPRDNLINDDKDLEYNGGNFQYPEGLKEESQNNSQRIEENERISNNIYKAFLVKVYGILSVQLFITLFLILFFQKDSIKSYFLNRPFFTGFLGIISFIAFLGCLFMLSAKQDLGKKVPYNYLTLLKVDII